MKKSFFLSLSILLLALSFAACQKPEDGPVNPTPPEQEDTLVAENGDPIQLENFTITLESLHSGDVLIDIKPEDKDMTYWYSLQIKEEVPAEDEDIFQADMEYFEYLCRYYGITLHELLSQNLVHGNTDWRYRGLKANTEYVFYLYGIESDGTPTTTVNRLNFTTTKVLPLDCTFEIIPGDEITSTSFSFTILPSDENVGYYYDLFPAAWYEEYCGSSEENIPAFIEAYLPALASENGMSIEEVVGAVSAFGPIVDDFSAEDGIEPSSNYYVFAIAIGANGTAVTDATVLEIRTANPPTNTFQVVEGSVEDDRATFYVSPYHSESYVALFELQEYMYDVDGTPLTDEGIIETIIAAQGSYIYNHMYSGSSTITDCPLIPEKDYWCLVFGYKDGEVTTPLTKVAFRTKEADAINSDIIISVGNITSSSAEVSFQPYLEPMPHMFNYMPYSTYVAYGANDDAIKRFNDELVDQLWDPTRMSKEEWLSRALETTYNSWLIEDLEPETKYLVYAIGMVPDGSYTTQAFTKEFTTKEVKEGPQIQEILFTQSSQSEGKLVSAWFYFENASSVKMFKSSHLIGDTSVYDMSDSELISYLSTQTETATGIYVAQVTNQTYITVNTDHVPVGETVYYAGAVYDADGNYSIFRTSYTVK